MVLQTINRDTKAQTKRDGLFGPELALLLDNIRFVEQLEEGARLANSIEKEIKDRFLRVGFGSKHVFSAGEEPQGYKPTEVNVEALEAIALSLTSDKLEDSVRAFHEGEHQKAIRLANDAREAYEHLHKLLQYLGNG